MCNNYCREAFSIIERLTLAMMIAIIMMMIIIIRTHVYVTVNIYMINIHV